MVDLFNMGGKEAKALMNWLVWIALSQNTLNNPKKYNNIAEVEVNVGGGAKVAGLLRRPPALVLPSETWWSVRLPTCGRP